MSLLKVEVLQAGLLNKQNSFLNFYIEEFYHL